MLFAAAWQHLSASGTSCNGFGCGLQGETLFRTVIEVAGGGGGGGGGGGNTEAAVRTALDDYMARLPELLNMVEVHHFLCTRCLLECDY